jgi:hypothetical protein
MGTTLPRSSRTDSSVVDLPAHRQHGGARPCTRQTPAHSPTSQRWGAVRGEERRGTWLASRWARLADGTLSLGSGRNGAHSLSPGKCCNRCCPFIASRGLHRPCRCRPREARVLCVISISAGQSSFHGQARRCADEPTDEAPSSDGPGPHVQTPHHACRRLSRLRTRCHPPL